MKLNVFSEIGTLKHVLVHTPGLEVDRMPPAIMEELLFDDIVYGPVARKEHETFKNIITAFGAKCWDSQDLLKEALETAFDKREEIFNQIFDLEMIQKPVIEKLRQMTADELSRALIQGVLAEPDEISSDHFFDLTPTPNLLMARDAQIVLGNGVIVSAMKKDARVRENAISSFIFQYHPEFQDKEFLLNFDEHTRNIPNQKFGTLSIEGGDILVFKEGVVLVGISERTMERSIDTLAEYLRERDEFKAMIMVRMPSSRMQMHLDTIFTRISEEELLVYPPMLMRHHAETLSVVSMDLSKGSTDCGIRHRSLEDAFDHFGWNLKMIPCGGENDYVQQTREQWTDGTNSFALMPGIIILYDRNMATLEQLKANGYTILEAEDFVQNARDYRGERENGGRKFVIKLPSSELSRARGGPRCMTMPLDREKV